MNDHKGIDLYAGYQRLAKQKKSTAVKPGLAFLPLLLLVLILAAVYLIAWRKTYALQKDERALDDRIAALQPRYDQAQEYSGEASTVDELYSELLNANALFNMYPVIRGDLILQVEACAAGIFDVTAYGFEETSGVLNMNAKGPSVNDVPVFIGRLRDTGEFTSVQYTGYTSDTEGVYYCTGSCLLPQSDLYGTILALGSATDGAAALGTDATPLGDAADEGDAADDETAQ